MEKQKKKQKTKAVTAFSHIREGVACHTGVCVSGNSEREKKTPSLFRNRHNHSQEYKSTRVSRPHDDFFLGSTQTTSRRQEPRQQQTIQQSQLIAIPDNMKRYGSTLAVLVLLAGKRLRDVWMYHLFGYLSTRRFLFGIL